MQIKILFENEKQTQLFHKKKIKSIFRIKYEQWRNNVYMFTCVNEDKTNIVKYIQLDFKDEIQSFVLNHDQLKSFDILLMKQRITCIRRNSWKWKNFLCEIFNTLVSNPRKKCVFNNNNWSCSFMIIPTCLCYTYSIYNSCFWLSLRFTTTKSHGWQITLNYEAVMLH